MLDKKWQTQPAWSPAPRRSDPRILLDLPPGVTPQAAYPWAAGDPDAQEGRNPTDADCSVQPQGCRKVLGRAEEIKRRNLETRSEGLDSTAASVPLVPWDHGASPHVTLLWATKIATEAEEIINATLLTSCNVVRPMNMGMMPSRRAKCGVLRRTVSW